MRARVIIAALGVIVVAAPSSAHKPTVTTFTYNKDIFPIFAAKCGSCHRSGGVAPMSLLTYNEAYPWGVAIKNEVLNLAMPPWFADERYGTFKHAGGLSAKEMDTIVDWCLGGSPEGDAPMASPTTGDAGWTLGEPTIVIVMPEPMVLDASTSESVETVALETGLAEAAYVRAVDFRPGAPNVVRSAHLFVEGHDAPIATWVPGQLPDALPDDRGRLIPSGAALSLRVHYKKTWLDDGTEVEDRSALALYLHPGATTDVVDTVAVSAGSAYRLDRDAELVALLPKVEGSVDAIAAELVRPDGSREPILRLYQPSPDWPRKYWLEEPLVLPSGSRVEVTATPMGDAVPAAILLDLASE